MSYKLKLYNLTPYILTPSHFTTKQFESTTIQLLFSSLTPYILTPSHFAAKILLYEFLIFTLITPKLILQLTHTPKLKTWYILVIHAKIKLPKLLKTLIDKLNHYDQEKNLLVLIHSNLT